MHSVWRIVLLAALGAILAFGIACSAASSEEDLADTELTMEDAYDEDVYFDDDAYEEEYAAEPAFGRDSDAAASPPFGVQSEPLISTTDRAESAAGDGLSASDGGFTDARPPGPAQSRLIVRIVDMSIEVDGIADGMEAVGALAVRRGGWVVSQMRPTLYHGSISIRVPSAQLDDAVQEISALGLDVISFSSRSQDVTEEYIDVQSRIDNLTVTLGALRALLDTGGELEDILEVQREITRVSEEIEVLEGRKRYLEQTSAMSLITVQLTLAPGELDVDPGPDLRAVEGEAVSFRATFNEQDGIESYEYRWDFGDGYYSEPRVRTAPTETDGERITETVRHRYESGEESPYFVTLTIVGRGEAGIVEGEASLKVVIDRVPTVIISLDEEIEISAGEEAALSAVFSRPDEVSTLTYEWDFGDGLSPAAGDIADDQSMVETTHIYEIARSFPYQARLTLRGETDFGATVKADAVVRVHVQPQPEWVIGFLDVGDTARSATRALSVIAQSALVGLIWMALLSPLWGPIVLVMGFLYRRWSGSRRRRRESDSQQERKAQQEDSAGTSQDG